MSLGYHTREMLHRIEREEMCKREYARHSPPTRAALYLLIPVAVLIVVMAVELGRAFVGWVAG